MNDVSTRSWESPKIQERKKKREKEIQGLREAWCDAGRFALESLESAWLHRHWQP